MKDYKVNNINWDGIKKAAADQKLTMANVSVLIGFDGRYLYYKKQEGWLHRSVLIRVANLLNVDYDMLILKKRFKEDFLNKNMQYDTNIIEHIKELENVVANQTESINKLTEELSMLNKTNELARKHSSRSRGKWS